ncbi:hypothetical protein [Nonomuraea typhae]|uniref:Uncharacterized protein n=1 Tax=Nonomuraea typhae TaxID=2603600 RepID=A0ABW7YJ95_9ACTN
MSTVLLRSDDYRVRLQAAIFMLNNARAEQARLEALHGAESDAFIRVILGDRIAALTGHVQGWKDYINDGCPLERRAQVTPRTYAHLKEV